MSFLANINPKKDGEEKKVNPLARKNPFAKPLAKKEDTATPVPAKTEEKAAPATEATKKVFPFAKKKNPLAPKTTAAPAEAKEEAKVETPAATNTEEATPDIVKAVEDQVVAEEGAETAKAVEAEKKPEDSAPKSNKRGGNRRGGSAKKTDTKPTAPTDSAKDTAATEEAPVVPVDIPTTGMSYAEAVAHIVSPFADTEWDEFKAGVEAQLNELQITDDMNPATLKLMITELDVLRQTVWSPYQEKKSLFEMLTSKEPCGIIERVSRLNLGNGNNDMERKKAGIMACMTFSTKEGTINLYELMDETRIRYNFLKEVMDSIKYKTDALITMSASLKLEKDHVVRGE